MTSSATISFAAAGKRRWDAIVVGAGPAGALAARQLAREGAEVLLLDRKAFPRWKVCGACVNQHALSVLREVDLHDLVERLGAVPIDKFQLCVGSRHATLTIPGGVAVSRAQFDAALVRSAVEVGAQFLPETQAVLAQMTGNARCVELNQSGRSNLAMAQVVLAAGGLGSRFLARERQFRTKTTSTSRIGVGVVAQDQSDDYLPGTIYMAVGRNGYVGLVRVEDGRLNIAAALSRRFAKQAGSVENAARSIVRSAGLPVTFGPVRGPVSAFGLAPEPSWQGTVTLTRRTKPVAHDRVFVLGDAAAYVEPFTGEGIAWALASAVAVAPIAKLALQGWSPELAARWTSAYQAIIGRRQWLCRAVALTLRHPFAVGAALRLLSWKPALASPVIQRLNAPISKAYTS